ncbi:MAG: 1-(5-phosphoribosyl)-5-[(5-phosphoribosylamino)methylideneamino]imidazole-4-carboxamide isomerase [SAR202 cluster bacterium Io17-Chloro-G9]|nr:MAG: 1-(5-phosphoribosyl)-5-[(5-phosphoribosylamino)methylideneamino]imidazole-4-carboxamide isomerase [SAR202 cluster bacterium Io17-Chloro-G9]
MEVIPSIDLKAGRCVRLYQGDFSRETVYSEDPVAVAKDWQDQGAARLHLVDLDGAAQGNPANRTKISQILRILSIPVQVGGGIRSLGTAADLIGLGADRVVIGTAAVEDPDMVEALASRFGSQSLVVAVDARDGKVSTRGWTENTSVDVLELATTMAKLGAVRFLYTDISRDGTLTQPNYVANAELVEKSGMAVQASGGIASLDHIRRLKETGVEGVIIGSALYTGAVKLGEAIAVGEG